MNRSLIVDGFLYTASFFNWLSKKAMNGALFFFNWRRGKKVRK